MAIQYKNLKLAAVLAAPLTLVAAAAQAGGFVAPMVEPPVAVAEPAPVGSWQGGYAGLTLGYAFGGDDRVGIFENETERFMGDAGTLKLSGANAGLRLGYRWQKDRWVFGPELGYEAGSIKDDATGTIDGVTYDTSSKVKNVLALRLKTGYAVQPDLLVYGIAGVARADVEYEQNGVDEGYKKTGYIVGLGAEKMINDRWSVTGEYEYANFGKEDRVYGPVTTEATADYHNVKLGLNFKF